MINPTARAVTSGPLFHFFGYYDKTPWDETGRYLLALETYFMDRRPGPDNVAIVGMVDLQGGDQFISLSQTRALNWQQGAMLQWVPGSPDEIVFNDRQGDRFVGVVLNVQTGKKRVLEMPVYAVSPNGRDAVSLNFARLFDVRPGYGYAGVPDKWVDTICPNDDGLYHVDLQTGKARLIYSLAQARDLEGSGAVALPGMDTGKHRFNHAQFCWGGTSHSEGVTDGGTRFAVLHRWSGNRADYGVPWGTRLLTLNADGSEPFVLSDHKMISHYDWRDESHLIAWARRKDRGDKYFYFTDKSRAEPEIWGENVFSVDGHCSFSPNKEWMLTDTYPDKEGFRTLMLFHIASGEKHDIGRFHGPTPPDGEIRCDLHPRWNRDGTQVCIDSIHENGERQMYVLDVSGITQP